MASWRRCAGDTCREVAMGATGTSRWVLAFSRQCRRCLELAREVEVIADRRLHVEPLDAPDIVRARRAVFGDAPPWRPTLLAFDGGHIRGWTGAAMAWRLSWRLGPRRALRVLAAVRRTARPDQPAYGAVLPSPSASPVELRTPSDSGRPGISSADPQF